jgi:hypothetical protein
MELGTMAPEGWGEAAPGDSKLLFQDAYDQLLLVLLIISL